jgi:hypothetical protein
MKKGRREDVPAAQPGSKFIGNCNGYQPRCLEKLSGVRAPFGVKKHVPFEDRKTVARATPNFSRTALSSPATSAILQLSREPRPNAAARSSPGRSQIRAECLRWPVDRRVLQASLHHLASQLIGVLANGLVRRELMLVGSISLDLLSNVFVEMSEPLVRHTFDAHHHTYC